MLSRTRRRRRLADRSFAADVVRSLGRIHRDIATHGHSEMIFPAIAQPMDVKAADTELLVSRLAFLEHARAPENEHWEGSEHARSPAADALVEALVDELGQRGVFH